MPDVAAHLSSESSARFNRRESARTVVRSAKILLLAGLALLYSLVVFNNLVDFNSNFEFVRHVLSMDTTFAGDHAMSRALHSPWIHQFFYLSIIAWEGLMAIFCWWGVVSLFRARRRPALEFNFASRIAIAALTLSLMLWLVAFLGIGGEWFLMWQSRIWNGQEAAFRNFTIAGIVLLVFLQPEPESRP